MRLSAKDLKDPVGRFTGYSGNKLVVLSKKDAFGGIRTGSLLGVRTHTAVSRGTVFGVIKVITKNILSDGSHKVFGEWLGYWKYSNECTSFINSDTHEDLAENAQVYWFKDQVRDILDSDIRKAVSGVKTKICTSVSDKTDDTFVGDIKTPKPDFSETEVLKPAHVKEPVDMFLMCKDVAVYNITKDIVLNTALLPGAMRKGGVCRDTMGFNAWMKTRYSAGSNVTARRLMLRAFGTDKHGNILKVTRALSLSDCYWLKEENELIRFADVTPYFNSEWCGTGVFTGGSIATLFVNGAADKCWDDAKTLRKVSAHKEMEVYRLCGVLGVVHSKARLDGLDVLVTNFTSTKYFLESAEQSGYIGATENHMERWIEIFKEHAVSLFVIDYLVEHDDRHTGNFGFLRNADTGEYFGMAPYYDFDWAFCSNSTPLPDIAFKQYGEHIRMLCEKAKSVASELEHGAIIEKRADELLKILKNSYG